MIFSHGGTEITGGITLIDPLQVYFPNRIDR